MINFKHIPVLSKEVNEALQVKNGEKYIDATVGGAGHTKEIILRGGIVLGIDRDDDALEHLKAEFSKDIYEKRLTIAKGNFKNIDEIAKANNFGKVSGILFDIGVSSYQLDSSNRGFSFRKNEFLDMRMDKSTKLTAWNVVNGYSEDILRDIFIKYGEEEKATLIAKRIIEARGKKKIDTTNELANLIEEIVKKSGKTHPATRVFQAIRIEVNNELESLREGLNRGLSLIDRGRVCVISFHSLEDRITKQQFINFERQGLGKVLTKKPITASINEVSSNPRAKSAKLRIFEKI